MVSDYLLGVPEDHPIVLSADMIKLTMKGLETRGEDLRGEQGSRLWFNIAPHAVCGTGKRLVNPPAKVKLAQ